MEEKPTSEKAVHPQPSLQRRFAGRDFFRGRRTWRGRGRGRGGRRYGRYRRFRSSWRGNRGYRDPEKRKKKKKKKDTMIRDYGEKEIVNWIEIRKRNFPTKNKANEIHERKKKGEFFVKQPSIGRSTSGAYQGRGRMGRNRFRRGHRGSFRNRGRRRRSGFRKTVAPPPSIQSKKDDEAVAVPTDEIVRFGFSPKTVPPPPSIPPTKNDNVEASPKADEIVPQEKKEHEISENLGLPCGLLDDTEDTKEPQQTQKEEKNPRAPPFSFRGRGYHRRRGRSRGRSRFRRSRYRRRRGRRLIYSRPPQSMYEKLLDEQKKRESSVVLQCFQYVLNNRFFVEDHEKELAPEIVAKLKEREEAIDTRQQLFEERTEKKRKRVD